MRRATASNVQPAVTLFLRAHARSDASARGAREFIPRYYFPARGKGYSRVSLRISGRDQLHASRRAVNRCPPSKSHFETTSFTPFARASFNNCGELCTVNMTTDVFGASWL